MNRYVVSPDARTDLDEIWQFIAEDNVNAADRMMRALRDRFKALVEQPMIGEARPDLAPGIRHSVVGRYLIFYRLSGDEIEVVRVLHGSRDLPAEFGRRTH
jgi:toxin ParE1/3/4